MARSNTSPRDASSTPERTTSSSSLTIVRPLVVFVTNSPDERRAVEFFHHKAAPQLSGYFHSRFWSELVLQVAVDEPAVRHAMIALSSIYESDVYTKSGSPDAALKRQNFGLESYNRAIRLLISDMGSEKSVRVPLITCVIFVCVDCLRREISVALKHIEGGMRLLETWRKKHHDPSKRDELLRSVDFEIVEEQLCPMFVRSPTWHESMATINFNHRLGSIWPPPSLVGHLSQSLHCLPTRYAPLSPRNGHSGPSMMQYHPF